MTTELRDVTIRRATAMDAVNIVRLLKDGWSEQRHLPPSRVNDVKALRWVIQHIEQSFVVVADLSGRIVGSIACRTVEEPMSDEWYIERVWFYAIPSFHGTPNKLLVEAESFSEEQGLPLVVSVDSFRPERFDRLMASRRRYVSMGGTYMRVLEAIDDGASREAAG
jgi:hypothetical protein